MGGNASGLAGDIPQEERKKKHLKIRHAEGKIINRKKKKKRTKAKSLQNGGITNYPRGKRGGKSTGWKIAQREL